MGGKKLLLDEDEGGDFSLKVNEGFAKRFEHNKQREELHRLQAKHPEIARRLEAKALKAQNGGQDDEDEDDSTTEEEDDGFIPDETEAQIFETLLKIRSKDPSIYDSEVKFFNDENDGDSDEQEGGRAGAAKHKPQYLKDVLAKQALEHGPDASSSDDDAGAGDDDDDDDRPGHRTDKPKQLYDEEQVQLRQAFLSAIKVDDDDDVKEDAFGGILKKRAGAKTGQDDDLEEAEAEAGPAGKKVTKSKKKVVQKLADAYFGSADDQADRFLKDFILNKGWVEKSEMEALPTYDEVVDEGVDEEDAAYLEQADRFEAAYNFRFEEPGAATITSHPRDIEGTVRRADERRRKAREAKKARQDEAQAALQEEVKRLKNLKKKEIHDRLAQIAKVAGAPIAGGPGGDADDEDEQVQGQGQAGGRKSGGKATKKGGLLRLDAALLDGDFDPEEWDRQMAAAFDDEYYEAGDDDLSDQLLGSDAEEEMAALIGKLSDDDDEDAGAGQDEEEEQEEQEGEGGKPITFKALRKKLVGAGGSEEGVEGLEDDDEEARGKAAAAAQARAELNQLMQEYHKLDHEGVAGGIKTRFKYRQVPAESYGLSVEDILVRSDKELNQVVGLKRLAPYREDQGKQRPNYKALEEMKKSKPEDNRHKRKPHSSWNAGDKGRRWDGQDRSGRFDKRDNAHQHKKHKHEGSTGEQPEQPQQQQQSAQPQKQQAEPHPPHKDRQQQAQQQNGKPGQPQQQTGKKSKDKPWKHKVLDPEAARKASYAPLVIPGPKDTQSQDKKRKQQDGGAPEGKKQKTGPAPQPVTGPNGEVLTKAQRKNLKRTLKRAAAKGGSESA